MSLLKSLQLLNLQGLCIRCSCCCCCSCCSCCCCCSCNNVFLLVLLLHFFLRLMRATQPILACLCTEGLLLWGSSKRWFSLVTLDERRLCGLLFIWRFLPIAYLSLGGIKFLKCAIWPISADITKRVWLFSGTWAYLICDIAHSSFWTAHEIAYLDERLAALDR